MTFQATISVFRQLVSCFFPPNQTCIIHLSSTSLHHTIKPNPLNQTFKHPYSFLCLGQHLHNPLSNCISLLSISIKVTIPFSSPSSSRVLRPFSSSSFFFLFFSSSTCSHLLNHTAPLSFSPILSLFLLFLVSSSFLIFFSFIPSFLWLLCSFPLFPSHSKPNPSNPVTCQLSNCSSTSTSFSPSHLRTWPAPSTSPHHHPSSQSNISPHHSLIPQLLFSHPSGGPNTYLVCSTVWLEG
eukprot:TRINITY_DN7214_c0_g1_i1.p1 TRINITY_DN7214_c0_g1~~TRINITY_DN7214_c0_g1_i1.p1  ORF type:complete len:239 (+),score=26.88 TRINITY_DN7214_c0_g1_i1:89-805(+)